MLTFENDQIREDFIEATKDYGFFHFSGDNHITEDNIMDYLNDLEQIAQEDKKHNK